MILFKNYKTREAWLNGRKNSIGASEAAVACGISKFKTQSQLWREKTGRAKESDLSDNELVAYGTEAEQYLRALFALKHRDYKIEYFPFKVYYKSETPFITCTLDGEITTADGQRGIYECKTKLINSRKDLEEWDGKIPENYFIQVLQQLYCTDFDFVVLNAEIRFPDGNAEIREYTIDRRKHFEDIEWVVEQDKDFWKHIEKDECPPERFTL